MRFINQAIPAADMLMAKKSNVALRSLVLCGYVEFFFTGDISPSEGEYKNDVPSVIHSDKSKARVTVAFGTRPLDKVVILF